jgi:hypothetical protein
LAIGASTSTEAAATRPDAAAATMAERTFMDGFSLEDERASCVENSCGSVPTFAPGRRVVKGPGILDTVSKSRGYALLALLLVACGVAVLALPSSAEGPEVIHFGPGHGPSLVDLAGIALVVPGGLWLLTIIVRGLPALQLPPAALTGLGTLFGVGLGLTIASVFADFGAWWIIGLGLLTVAEAYLLARLWRSA